MKIIEGSQTYSNHAGGTYEVPRCEWLIKSVKQIEANLIAWYKANKCNQGDSYSCAITDMGLWKVSHTNDYPMQHGDGSRHVFTHVEFKEAQKLNAKPF